MNIAIYYRSKIDYVHKDPNAYPLPGSSTAVLRVAAALRTLGNIVSIITNPDSFQKKKKFDVLIVKRNPTIPILYPEIARAYFFWSPDLISELSFLPLKSSNIMRQFLGRTQKIIAISDFQRHQYNQIGIPDTKIYLSRNGIEASLFTLGVTKDPLRCIYVSTHCDGLEYLRPIWVKVIENVPNATLKVIAARSIYGQSTPPRIERALQRIQNTRGVTSQPPVSQQQLAQELLRSAVFLYPNTHPETSSIITLEAKAAGCIIVTSARGALVESAKGNFLLPGHPSSQQYQRQCAFIVSRILRRYAHFQNIVQLNRQSALFYNWRTIAQEWMSLFISELGEKDR